MIHASVLEQQRQNYGKQYPVHSFSKIGLVLIHNP